MFDGIFALIAKRAGNAIMTYITASVSHSPAGWPTIEESFDIDTMGRGFNLATKALETIDSSSNRMAKRNAESEPLESTTNLVDKFSSSLALSSLLNDLQNVLLQSFLFESRFLEPIGGMHDCFGKVSVHSTLGKNKVHNKGVAMPLRVRMVIVKMYTMSNDSKPDFSRESVEIQRGKASNTNFRSTNGVSDVPNLCRKSNISEREKESRWQPVSRANEEFTFKVLQEVVNFVVAGGKLPSISEEGHDKDIGGEDVVEEACAQILPSLNRICPLLDGIVKLSVR